MSTHARDSVNHWSRSAIEALGYSSSDSSEEAEEEEDEDEDDNDENDDPMLAAALAESRLMAEIHNATASASASSSSSSSLSSVEAAAAAAAATATTTTEVISYSEPAASFNLTGLTSTSIGSSGIQDKNSQTSEAQSSSRINNGHVKVHDAPSSVVPILGTSRLAQRRDVSPSFRQQPAPALDIAGSSSTSISSSSSSANSATGIASSNINSSNINSSNSSATTTVTNDASVSLSSSSDASVRQETPRSPRPPPRSPRSARRFDASYQATL